jgi:hypothetical protein
VTQINYDALLVYLGTTILVLRRFTDMLEVLFADGRRTISQ